MRVIRRVESLEDEPHECPTHQPPLRLHRSGNSSPDLSQRAACRDFSQDADLSHAPWPRTTRSEHSHSTLSHELPTPLRAFVRSVNDPAARRALLRPANLEEHCEPSAPWAPELTPLNAAPHALNVVVSLTHSGSFVQPTRLWREQRDFEPLTAGS